MGGGEALAGRYHSGRKAVSSNGFVPDRATNKCRIDLHRSANGGLLRLSPRGQVRRLVMTMLSGVSFIRHADLSEPGAP